MRFSLGDYVWVRLRRRSGRRWLARIESSQPYHHGNHTTWLVRVRDRNGWQTPVHADVDLALSPAEVAHNRHLGLIPPLERQLGLIPQPGDPL